MYKDKNKIGNGFLLRLMSVEKYRKTEENLWIMFFFRTFVVNYRKDMNRKKIFTVLCALVVALAVQAKSLRELWVSMPDSLVPVLTQNMRVEFTELQDMKVKAEVTTSLGDTSVMDTLTNDFMQIRLSRVCTLRLKKLPQTGGDSIICMVRTLAAPEKESEVMFFDQQWQQLEMTHCFDGEDIQGVCESLLQRPDTMSVSRFEELKAMIEPRMMSALLMQHENAIAFRLALPLLSAEDKKLINAIKVQRKFNWNGKIFKEG